MIVWFSWIISICKIYGEYRTAGHLVFSTSWPTVELKKILSVTKHGFVFSAQCEPNIILEIYKAFQDRLTFLNRHMIVWFSWICSICEIYWKDRTAGHLVFWKPWLVTGHIATATISSNSGFRKHFPLVGVCVFSFLFIWINLQIGLIGKENEGKFYVWNARLFFLSNWEIAEICLSSLANKDYLYDTNITKTTEQRK